MSITVRYFAAVREQLGSSGLLLPWVDIAAHTVGEARQSLIARSPAPLYAAALDLGKGLRTACNQTLCNADQALQDGDEVAFFPPVTGG